MSHTEKDLIRPAKAAKIIKYSYSYICFLAREGTLTRYYVGKRSYLLDKKEVLSLPSPIRACS